ncbi:MAG: oxidoreductase, partial [Asticcacaulis sp.]|nr:oxidoreductase [Asticcacaulis sp.]
MSVNVALVGYGYAGRIIHAPLIRAAEGLQLSAIVSGRPADVHADIPTQRVLPFDEVLDNPGIDVVVIATPNDLHAPQAHAALEAGKHVVIDKPFALNVPEAEELIRHAKRADRLLSVFHSRRWDSNNLTLSALKPRLGTLSQVILRYDRWRPVVQDRWRERKGPGSGIWFDLGSHLVDQSLSQFGWPDWISADIAGQREGAKTDDYFHVVLGYGPLRVILHSSMLTSQPGACIEVQGHTGSFVKYGMDTQEEQLKAHITPGSPGWGADPVAATLTVTDGENVGQPAAVTATPGNYLGYYEQLARAIAQGADNPV